MNDPFGDVRTGQAIPTDKRTWNAILKNARTPKQLSLDAPQAGPQQVRTVKLQNTTPSTTYYQFRPVTLGALVDVTLQSRQPVFEIDDYCNDGNTSKVIAILQEPSRPGSIVEGIVLGYTPASLSIGNVADEFAFIGLNDKFRTDDVGLPLLSGAPGSFGNTTNGVWFRQDLEPIQIKNTSGTTFQQYHAVQVHGWKPLGLSSTPSIDKWQSDRTIKMFAATEYDPFSTQGPCGIVQSECAPGETAYCVVEGFTKIVLSVAASTTGYYFKPQADGTWIRTGFPTTVCPFNQKSGSGFEAEQAIYLIQMPHAMNIGLPVKLSQDGGSGGSHDTAVSFTYKLLGHTGQNGSNGTSIYPIGTAVSPQRGTPKSGIEFHAATRGLADVQYRGFEGQLKHLDWANESIATIYDSAITEAPITI